jgi:hypothetical protein
VGSVSSRLAEVRAFDVSPDVAQSTYTQIARRLSVHGGLAPTAVQEEIDENLTRLGREPGMQASELIELALLRDVQQDLGTG